MLSFDYKALDSDGNTIEGHIEATSQSSALGKLSQRGLTVFELEPLSSPNVRPREVSKVSGIRVGDTQLAQACLDIAQLLFRKYSVEQALTIAGETSDDRAIQILLESTREELKRGVSLSEAFASQNAQLPKEFLTLLHAGDGANSLQLAFSNAGQLLLNRSKSKASVVAALAYPGMLLLGTLGVFIFIQVQLVPTLYATSVGSGNGPPVVLRTLSEFNRWVSENSAIIMAFFAVTVCSLYIWRSQVLNAIVRFVRPLRKLALEIEYARTARILAAFISSGESLIHAMKAAQEVTSLASTASIFERAIQSLLEGEPASGVFNADQNVPRGFAYFYQLGETSNDLETNLIFAAELLENNSERKTKKWVGLVGPAMTLFVGVLVGFVVYVLISTVLGATAIAI